MEQNDRIKKIVETIAVSYTRGTLEDVCRFYYDAYNRRVEKAKRGELEQIAFIRMALNIDPAGIYEVSADDTTVLELAYAPKVIYFILHKTIFNWYEEPEYPITRDARQSPVTVKQVVVRSIF